MPSPVTGTSRARLTQPLVWRYGALNPTGWDDALGLVADVTRRVVEEQGEDGLIVSAYDHGGAGGGYENVWATGKLYFDSMKVRNIRIHNRPAYNSEVHGTRDMGVRELNNCYEDAELADTLFIVGANSLEAQTNYFLNHWVPNLRGTSMEKKRALLPGEPHAPGRLVMVDPRRTVTVDASEAEAGADNVLHLQINSGTDLVLFNALLTEIADRGWMDRAFVDASTTGFDAAVAANRTSVEDAADITGLSPESIRKAASWIAEPKDGHRRRTMLAYEKGLIWGNDNYRTNQALVNLGLATGNIGRPGGGCVRPSDAHIGRPDLAPSTRREYRRRLERALDAVMALAPAHRDGQRLRRRYGKLRSHLFTFLDHPEVPADNNGSESELRPAANLPQGHRRVPLRLRR